MTDADTATETHVDHDQDHAHELAAEPLGEPDLRAWGAAILGGAVGLVVVLALLAAISS